VPSNILLADWTGAYGGVPPWDQVKVSDFPEALTRADHTARADRFFYKENAEASQRAATLAGRATGRAGGGWAGRTRAGGRRSVRRGGPEGRECGAAGWFDSDG
jgi:hypothetical protein